MKDDNKEVMNLLNDIIEHETDKPEDQMDCDLIAQCSDMLIKINGENKVASSVMTDQISQIKEKNRKIIAQKNKAHLKRQILKIAAAAFAAVLILAAPITVKAAIEKRNPFDVLREYGMSLFDIPDNGVLEVDGITFEKDNIISVYSDIESLLSDNDINILYPTWLPEGVYINAISVKNNSVCENISFEFSSDMITYWVGLSDIYGDIAGSDCETLDIDQNVFYLYHGENDNKIHAMSTIDGYSYSASSDDRDTLILFLKGLERHKL